jgi:hypothetical protein
MGQPIQSASRTSAIWQKNGRTVADSTVYLDLALIFRRFLLSLINKKEDLSLRLSDNHDKLFLRKNIEGASKF